jgi:lycopene cyclase domain-containing protein
MKLNNFEYFIFNIIVVLGPLLAILFYPAAKIPTLAPALMAIFLTAVVFIIWDELVTNFFWKFNFRYILGFKIIKLPIEEILFFFTVPFACLFLWVNFPPQSNIQPFINFPIEILIVLSIIFFVLSLIMIYKKIYYTGIVILFFLITIMITIIINPYFIFQKRFLFFLFPVLFLTFIFNGYLTSRPVVTYNKKVKSNINIWTIPIEDFIYGLILIVINVFIYENLILI